MPRLNLQHYADGGFDAAWAMPALLVVVLLGGVAGCGSDDSTSTTPVPLPPPVITTLTLPDGTINAPYSATLQVTSGTSPFSWSVSAGSLPAGLTLDSATGEITGTPTMVGASTFTITVVDAMSMSSVGDYTVVIGDTTSSVELVTVASDGVTPANGDSGSAAISSDARLVVFTSFATNLIANDTNNLTDIFVRDRSCGATARVSVASDGTEGSNNSLAPAISPDGSFVAYASDADNLVANDTNTRRDIFVTALNTTTCPPTVVDTARVNLANDGTEADAASALPTVATGPNGPLVVYHSLADTLVEIDGNGAFDIFVTEIQFSGGTFGSLRTRRISTFLRLADQLADIFGSDTIGNTTLTLQDDEEINFLVEIVAGTGQDQVRVVTDNDATTLTVAPPWDPANEPDNTSVFRILRVAVSSSFRGRISADGAFVTFNSLSNFEDEDTNGREDVFLHELATGLTTRVSVDTAGALSDGTSNASALSGNGSVILFRSSATNLVSGDTNLAGDLFVHDPATPETLRVSLADDGSEADPCVDANVIARACAEITAALSGGGRLVAFSSFATNLLPDDRNFEQDVFLRDRQASQTRRLSLGLGGINPDGESLDPAISLDGSSIVFASAATNLVLNDTNDARDIFLVTTGIIDPPTIVVSSLPAGLEGKPYSVPLLAVGGTRPLFWSIEKGAVPQGLFLDPSTGVLSGIPGQQGRFRFTVVVMDSERPTRTGRKQLTLVIGP